MMLASERPAWVDELTIAKKRVDDLVKVFVEDVQEESRYTIPEFTCPAIDRVIENINTCLTILKCQPQDDDLDEITNRLNSMWRSVESLRRANETLRLCGNGWKALCKSMLDRVKGL